MKCKDPGCTGSHRTVKYEGLCPSAKRRHNARPYRQSVRGQTMRYLANVRYTERRDSESQD